MNTNCIQIKLSTPEGVKTIQFSGLDVYSALDLNSVLGNINKSTYYSELTKLKHIITNEQTDAVILEEADVTRIADSKVGNVSLFTLSSLLLNKGSLNNKTISFLVNALKLSNIDIKSGEISITNTDSPKFYVGTERTLLELPSKFTEGDVVSGLRLIYADRQLQNIRSPFYNSIKTIYTDARKLNAETWAYLDTVPGEYNKVKRFFYDSFTLKGEGQNEILIKNVKDGINSALNTSLSSLKGRPVIEDNYYSQKQVDYLYENQSEDLIELDSENSVSLSEISKANKILSINPNKDKRLLDNNPNFAKELKADLLNAKNNKGRENDINKLINKIERAVNLTADQYNLIELKKAHPKIYAFVMDNYLDNSNGLQVLLANKVRKTYESFKDIVLENGNLNFSVHYDPKIMFKPKNRISFTEFERSTTYFKIVTNKESYDKITNKDLNIEFQFPIMALRSDIKDVAKMPKEQRLTTLNNIVSDALSWLPSKKVNTVNLTNIKELFNSDNNQDLYLTLVSLILDKGFNIELPTNDWVNNKKALSRADFIDAFTNKLNDIRKLNYEEFTLNIRSRFTNSSHFKLKVDEDTKNIITNDGDLINQDLNKLIVLSNVNKGETSTYNIKITDKVKIDPATVEEYKNTDNTIIHEYKQTDKNWYNITVEAIKNTISIEKNNITSEHFNGHEMLNRIVKDLNLTVNTFKDKDIKNKGRVENGEIYINVDNDAGINSETLLHEISHLLFAGIKAKNPNEYFTLLDHVNMRENEDSFNTFIQLEQYKDLSIYDKKEEFLVRELSRALDNQISTIDTIINFPELVQSMFKLWNAPNKFNLMHTTVASLMATYGSDYNKYFVSSFPETQRLKEMKLSEYVQSKIKSKEIIEKCQ